MSRSYFVIAFALTSSLGMSAQAQTVDTKTSTAQTANGNIDMSNVVRARFVKPGDVSPEEYQRLLAEADKIRAFQMSQGQYQAHYQAQYGGQYTQPAPYPQQPQYASQTPQNYGQTQGVQVEGGQIQGPFYQAQTPYQPQTSQPVQTYTYAQPYQQGSQPTVPQQTYVPVYPQPVPVPVPQPQAIPATYTSPQIAHAVVKGDTLYNISKRYGVPLASLRQANGLTTTTISIGQSLIIPSVQKPVSVPASSSSVPAPAYVQPQYLYQGQTGYVPQTYQGQQYVTQPQPTQAYPYAGAPTQSYRTQTQGQPSTYQPVSYTGAYPGTLRYQPAAQVPTSSTGNSPRFIRSVQSVPTAGVYAVLPKDTLYSISKISCVSPNAIARENGIQDVSTLQPGQRLKMPAGHCLK